MGCISMGGQGGSADNCWEEGRSLSCSEGREESSLGKRQVLTGEPLISRLVVESGLQEHVLNHVCRKLCLAFFFFWIGGGFGSACIFSFVFSTLF